MLNFIGGRILQLIPLLIAISIIIFFVIQLPPGNFLTTYINQLELSGAEVSHSHIENLKRQYGLDQPAYIQYFTWVTNIITEGNLGRSFLYDSPVRDVIGDRLAMTVLISSLTLIFVWIIAIPIGIFSAVRQYSVFDYIFTFFGFIGLATPNFLIALVLLYFIFTTTGISITGLFSPDYMGEPWSLGKVVDMLPRLSLAIFVIGTAGMASLIRVTRAMMLDELRKQYVITARAKGVPEKKLLFKYPVRVAINPLVSTIGF